MSTTKLTIIITVVLVLLLGIYYVYNTKYLDRRDEWSDAIMIADVNYIASLVERYYEQTGQYPLQADINTDSESILFGTAGAFIPKRDVHNLPQVLKAVLGDHICVPERPPYTRSDLDLPWYSYSVSADGYIVKIYIKNERPGTTYLPNQEHYAYAVGTGQVKSRVKKILYSDLPDIPKSDTCPDRPSF